MRDFIPTDGRDATTTNSILESVKADIGASEWDTAFDATIIREINTAFMILTQLGVGPETGFYIDGPEDTWGQYETGDVDIEGVKSYVVKKVKLSFDPSQSSFVNESDKEIVRELEWRLNVAVDPMQMR